MRRALPGTSATRRVDGEAGVGMAALSCCSDTTVADRRGGVAYPEHPVSHACCAPARMSPDPNTHALPVPDAEALAHSDRLAAAIRAAITTSEGSAIPFSRFMELALYAPGLGYYR